MKNGHKPWWRGFRAIIYATFYIGREMGVSVREKTLETLIPIIGFRAWTRVVCGLFLPLGGPVLLLMFGLEIIWIKYIFLIIKRIIWLVK